MKQCDYDSTVARIAGNIASGCVEDATGTLIDADAASVARNCVKLARYIVEETRRTEPKETP